MTNKIYEIVIGYMKQYQFIQPVIGISSAGVVDEQKVNRIRRANHSEL